MPPGFDAPIKNPTLHAADAMFERVLLDQYRLDRTFRKGSSSDHWPVPAVFGIEGSQNPKGTRLSSSRLFGNPHRPAMEPSDNPQKPSSKVLQSFDALGQVLSPKQLAFFDHINPVKLSVMVPSSLSLNRGLGHAIPILKSPSCPVSTQSTKSPAESRKLS